MINLWTTSFAVKDDARRKEYEQVLAKNLECGAIDRINILNEAPQKLGVHRKIKEHFVTSRPTYADYFTLINKDTKNEDIHIIANADIYFDENIGVLKYINLNGKCLALARWDLQPDGSAKLRNRNDSQDVWIFKGKVSGKIYGKFGVGLHRCDNRIMYELERGGYEVLNPAYSIRSYHLQSKMNKELPGNEFLAAGSFAEPPYRYKYPHNLYGFFETIAFNLVHKEKLGRYRYDIKRMNKWLALRIYRQIYKMIKKKEPSLIGYK